ATARVGALETDAAPDVADDDPAEALVGDEEVRAAAENEERPVRVVGRADRLDEVSLARRLDVRVDGPADAQRGEVREGRLGQGARLVGHGTQPSWPRAHRADQPASADVRSGSAARP